jgi:hypothetical protein
MRKPRPSRAERMMVVMVMSRNLRGERGTTDPTTVHWMKLFLHSTNYPGKVRRTP